MILQFLHLSLHIHPVLLRNVLGVIVVSPQIFIFFSMLCMHHPDTGNVFLRLFSSYRILPADLLRIRKYLPWYVPCLSFVLFSLL